MFPQTRTKDEVFPGAVKTMGVPTDKNRRGKKNQLLKVRAEAVCGEEQ